MGTNSLNLNKRTSNLTNYYHLHPWNLVTETQARTQGGGGGALGACAPSPPNPGKIFRSEMSKRGEKVPTRYVRKKECARSAQIPQIKTKKLAKKEENSKRKGLKLKK